MDAINKDHTMSKTPEQIVQDFVTNHALVDKYLALAYKAALKMAKDTEEGIKAGMVDQIEAKSFLARHRAAPGDIAEVAATFSDLHEMGTRIAKANEVDLGRLTTVGGVALPAKREGGR